MEQDLLRVELDVDDQAYQINVIDFHKLKDRLIWNDPDREEGVMKEYEKDETLKESTEAGRVTSGKTEKLQIVDNTIYYSS